MRIGIVNEDIWDFFHEIYADLSAHHQVTLFKRRRYQLPVMNERINRTALHRDLRTFMGQNEVVFFEWASELLAVASHLPKSCGIITRIHRYDLYEWLDKVRWEAVDKIILVSQAKVRELEKVLPAQAHKIVVIPEAISLERFKPHTKPFSGNLGILCHLKPRKRVYDLVLAFYELSQKMAGLHLYIGGDMRPLYADYHEALQRLVKELKLEEQVTFDGHVANPEQWYRKIDIFLSNSYSEGLQVSPMEAIASGCYCFSHFWDGADELLPEENLFYTSSELQAKLSAYCQASDEEKCQKQAVLRQLVTEKFDVAKTSAQIRQIIEQLGATQSRV